MALADIALWPFRPNWSSDLTETREWLSDVLMSQTGVEQRRSLRYYPRSTIEFQILVSGADRRHIDQFLITHGASDIYVPLWYDPHVVTDSGDQIYETGTTVEAASSLHISGANTGLFRAGGAVAVFDRTSFDNEILEIAEVRTNGLILASEKTRSWDYGATAYPCVRARLTDQPKFSRVTDDVSTASIRFKIVEATVDPAFDIVADGPLARGSLVGRQYFSTTADPLGNRHGRSFDQFNLVAALFRAYSALNTTCDAKESLPAPPSGKVFLRWGKDYLYDGAEYVVADGSLLYVNTNPAYDYERDTYGLPPYARQWLTYGSHYIYYGSPDNIVHGRGWWSFMRPSADSARELALRFMDGAFAPNLRGPITRSSQMPTVGTEVFAPHSTFAATGDIEDFNTTVLEGLAFNANLLTDSVATPVAGTARVFPVSYLSVLRALDEAVTLDSRDGMASVWTKARSAIKRTAVAGANQSTLNGLTHFPGSQPVYMLANTVAQSFDGWGGAVFVGDQYPELWLDWTTEANAVHGGGSAPGKMTQQLGFLAASQAAHVAAGGTEGAFAPMLISHSSASSLFSGSPTVGSWVWDNLTGDATELSHQARVVESLCHLVYRTTGNATYATQRASALSIAVKWLDWYAAQWADGYPSHVRKPPLAVQYQWSDVGSMALVVRACMWLKKLFDGTFTHQELMERCWSKLEAAWDGALGGEMAMTWANGSAWRSDWHGDIIATLAELMDNSDCLSPTIPFYDVATRLTLTIEWLANVGAVQSNSVYIGALEHKYRGFSVFTTSPNFESSGNFEYKRLVASLDNSVATAFETDVAGRAYTAQSHELVLRGRAGHLNFYSIVQGMRGKVVPFWLPTFTNDLVLAEPIDANDTTIKVERCGFTDAGGPRHDRQDIAIQMPNGYVIFRRIVESAIDGQFEVLALDRPLRENVPVESVIRISFMALNRLDQDSVTISHVTDMTGASRVVLNTVSAPDDRNVYGAG